MPSADADRNLLFGLLALQNNFISRDDLVAAVGAWLAAKNRPLDKLLVERNALPESQAELLRALVGAHLARHDNDPQQSLAALSSVGAMRDELGSLGDAYLDASLAIVGSARRDVLLDSTWPIVGLSAAGARFRILRPHAKGGLGEVSVARDLELHREVALKQIQPHLADDAISRQRFQLEAEITGGLEHPGIVPVYGMGHYIDGRPYYAMRFIRGDSLKEAVDRFHGGSAVGFASLPFRQLLGRFLDVCEAIEYAHSRGVLHRDLKPGNVMLGEFGETLVVDWGLAKVKGRSAFMLDGGETTLRPPAESENEPTQLGSAIGTPAYMPPEQAAGRLDMLGGASDVYSLGATLYYVLTGRPAFVHDDLGTTLRKVQNGEFPRPRNIRPQIPAALEAICVKAMSLHPANRYQTPRALADDLARFLADEPVTAHVEWLPALARRWLRKHPKAVTALAASVLIGVASALTIAAVVAAKNRDLSLANIKLGEANIAERASRREADLRRRQAELARVKEKKAKDDAEWRRQQAVAAQQKEVKERERAEAVTSYMVNTFRNSDPSQDGREVKVADVFDQAVARLDEDLKDRPLLQSQMLRAIAEAYKGLGLFPECLSAMQRAYELDRKTLGEDHPDTITSRHNLGLAYMMAIDITKALPLLEQSHAQMRATLGEDDPNTLGAMNTLAMAYKSSGNLAKSLPLLEECLRLRRAKLGDDHPDTFRSINDLALAYESAGDLVKALPLLENCLELRREKLGENHPDTLTSLDNLATGCLAAGDTVRALSLLEECLPKIRVTLGDDHPDTLTALNNLAFAHSSAGNLSKSLPLYEQCLLQRRAKLGEDHPDTLMSMNNLAAAYEKAGDLSRALPLYEQCLQKRQAKLGQQHPDTMTTLNRLEMAYNAANDTLKALPLFEQRIQGLRAKYGEDHPITLISVAKLAQKYLEVDQPERALPLFDQVVECCRRRYGSDVPKFTNWQVSVSNDLLSHRQFAPAEKHLRECLALREQADPDSWLTLNTKSMLGGALAGQAKFTEAEPLLLDGYNGLVAHESQIPPAGKVRVKEALQRVIDLYTAWDKPAELAKWQALVEPEAPVTE